MNTLIHADIFFFITTIIALIAAIFGVIVAYYIILILRYVLYIVEKVRDESDNVSDDIAELRGRIKESEIKFSAIIRTIASFFFGKVAGGRRRPPRE